MAQTRSAEKPCSLLVQFEKAEPPQPSALREALETGTEEIKLNALKKVILLHLNGEPMPQLLMTVIRFVMPMRAHAVKKLVLIYLEVIDKTGADGKLLGEMILVCNFLRNDLNSPNEYVRGVTLRFLCRLKEVSGEGAICPFADLRRWSSSNHCCQWSETI